MAAADDIVLVDRRWSTGGGLPAEDTVRVVEEAGRASSLTRLTDPAYWGRTITDDRYVVTSPPTA